MFKSFFLKIFMFIIAIFMVQSCSIFINERHIDNTVSKDSPLLKPPHFNESEDIKK